MTEGRRIFQGEFGEVLIPDILTFLDMIGKTGRLALTRGADSKNIYWERGEIVYADSSVPEEQIGEYLCRNGWIDREALDAATASSSGGRPDDLVKALLRTSALDPAVLPRALKFLVLDIVYSLFEWHDGTFAFELSSVPHGEKVVLRTSVSNIIMEGTRRLDEWQRIREQFPSDEVYPTLVADPPEVAVKLPPSELQVLKQVDGRRNIRDIVRLVEDDHFTVLTALVTLGSAGLISSSPTPVAAAPAPTDGLSDDQRRAAEAIVAGFGNIFAGIHARIAQAKGSAGIEQLTATIQKGSFQKSGLFEGVSFTPDGRLPADVILKNLGEIPDAERISRLKGTMDRLLAQQVLQLDTSYPADEKKAISDLIAREKEHLAST